MTKNKEHSTSPDLAELFFRHEENYLPHISINCVIIGFSEGTLQVIVNDVVLDRKRITVLPGGYLGKSEDLDHAVERMVRESTGLKDIPVQLFAIFGNANRSFASELQKLTGQTEKQIAQAWFAQRFISVGYLALVDHRKIRLHPNPMYQSARWIPLAKANSIAMDHKQMVVQAREALIRDLPHAPIAVRLLPEEFTLPELQILTEAILGRKVDRANFRRKILASESLLRVGSRQIGRGRPADVYRFRRGHQNALDPSVGLGF